MLNTKAAKEIIVRMPNEIGALDRMAKTISDKGINVLAISAWVEGAQAVIRLVTVGNLRVLGKTPNFAGCRRRGRYGFIRPTRIEREL